MRMRHRVKRLLGVGLVGAMVIALVPAGTAAADQRTISTDDVMDRHDNEQEPAAKPRPRSVRRHRSAGHGLRRIWFIEADFAFDAEVDDGATASDFRLLHVDAGAVSGGAIERVDFSTYRADFGELQVNGLVVDPQTPSSVSIDVGETTTDTTTGEEPSMATWLR